MQEMRGNANFFAQYLSLERIRYVDGVWVGNFGHFRKDPGTRRGTSKANFITDTDNVLFKARTTATPLPVCCQCVCVPLIRRRKESDRVFHFAFEFAQKKFFPFLANPGES